MNKEKKTFQTSNTNMSSPIIIPAASNFVKVSQFASAFAPFVYMPAENGSTLVRTVFKPTTYIRQPQVYPWPQQTPSALYRFF